ncbi:hypothetical protein [Rathayibacter festucae]|uniref:Uncharacterized protein n=1 Tax=Rathayibacter festucae DSM 15932 TaxID=1328866 RepID=A0A3Q9V089_9MICO|nr:hypothetical protein [Rathayibacter festucae]AZZ52617.1 hypothetical protein C1I64_11580 [Rathayibacter festucae DSM 15932]
MTAAVSFWPTQEPGRPYRWLLDLAMERPAPTCLKHRIKTDGLGVCPECVYYWRLSLGAVPDEWITCTVCALPIHPAAEVPGKTTCPTCDIEFLQFKED